MRKDGIISCVLLVTAGLALLCVLFVPIWKIDLIAPQYPEGLSLLIYSNKLGGNVDIINGLNHYIGMKTLHSEDFKEFIILPYAIVVFAILFFVAAIAGKKKITVAIFILFALFGVVAMVDFYQWEYNYGHNLNPDAAIKVPGMSYQPPLIGYKQLLNFSAYSMPYIGGWLFIIAGLLSLVSVVLVLRKKKTNNIPVLTSIIIGGFAVLFLSSCSVSPEPIRLGKDNCHSCKMTITDPRFGVEIITAKGKVFKFDDIHCALQYLRSADQERTNEVYFTDFHAPHSLIKAGEVVLLNSADLHSPMGSNIAAFSTQQSIDSASGQYTGKAMYWKDIYK